MASSAECKARAEECAHLERHATSLPMKVAFSNAERLWIRLAEQCERVGKSAASVAERPS
jgi:hypothetical protein